MISQGDWSSDVCSSDLLSSVFVKHAKETAGSEYLVYAEAYDIQPDDRQRLVKVLFKENNQAAGYLIHQSDRIIFEIGRARCRVRVAIGRVRDSLCEVDW